MMRRTSGQSFRGARFQRRGVTDVSRVLHASSSLFLYGTPRNAPICTQARFLGTSVRGPDSVTVCSFPIRPYATTTTTTTSEREDTSADAPRAAEGVNVKNADSYLPSSLDQNEHSAAGAVHSSSTSSSSSSSSSSVTMRLVVVRPDVVDDWVPELNELDVQTVHCYSPRIVWWRCGRCGSSYQASIKSRVKGGVQSCPHCHGTGEWPVSRATSEATATESAKAAPKAPHDSCVPGAPSEHVTGTPPEAVSGASPLPSFSFAQLLDRTHVAQSLAVTHPDIARRWDHARNGLLLPTHVTSDGTQCVWWLPASAAPHREETRAGRGDGRREPFSFRRAVYAFVADQDSREDKRIAQDELENTLLQRIRDAARIDEADASEHFPSHAVASSPQTWQGRVPPHPARPLLNTGSAFHPTHRLVPVGSASVLTTLRTPSDVRIALDTWKRRAKAALLATRQLHGTECSDNAMSRSTTTTQTATHTTEKLLIAEDIDNGEEGEEREDAPFDGEASASHRLRPSRRGFYYRERIRSRTIHAAARAETLQAYYEFVLSHKYANLPPASSSPDGASGDDASAPPRPPAVLLEPQAWLDFFAQTESDVRSPGSISPHASLLFADSMAPEEARNRPAPGEVTSTEGAVGATGEQRTEEGTVARHGLRIRTLPRPPSIVEEVNTLFAQNGNSGSRSGGGDGRSGRSFVSPRARRDGVRVKPPYLTASASPLAETSEVYPRRPPPFPVMREENVVEATPPDTASPTASFTQNEGEHKGVWQRHRGVSSPVVAPAHSLREEYDLRDADEGHGGGEVGKEVAERDLAVYLRAASLRVTATADVDDDTAASTTASPTMKETSTNDAFSSPTSESLVGSVVAALGDVEASSAWQNEIRALQYDRAPPVSPAFFANSTTAKPRRTRQRPRRFRLTMPVVRSGTNDEAGSAASQFSAPSSFSSPGRGSDEEHPLEKRSGAVPSGEGSVEHQQRDRTAVPSSLPSVSTPLDAPRTPRKVSRPRRATAND